MNKIDELREQIYVVPYVEIEPHLRRGTVLIIDEALDLAEVGWLLALDDKAAVTELLQQKQLAKASPADYEAWKREKRFFKILIIQPFVLAQNYVALKPEAAN